MPDDQAVSGAILPAAVGGKAEETAPLIMTNKKKAAIDPNASIATKLLFNDADKAEVAMTHIVHNRREWMALSLAEMDVWVWNTNCQLQATNEPQKFRHTLFNDCNFPIGIRLSCSNATRMRTERSYFCLEPGARYDFSVTIQPRYPLPDISERVVIGTMPVSEHFRQWPDWRARIKMIFGLAFKPVNFVIRYHKVPLWMHNIDQLSKFKLLSSGVKGKVNELFSEGAPVDGEYKDCAGFIAIRQALQDENEMNVTYWQKIEKMKMKEEQEKMAKEAEETAKEPDEVKEGKDGNKEKSKEDEKKKSAEDEKNKKSAGDPKDKKK